MLNLIIITSYYDIIHISHKIDTQISWLLEKYRAIHFTYNDSKFLKDSDEPPKPSSEMIFMTILYS